MKIVRTIEFALEPTTHLQITKLRNTCFPNNQRDRSYYKQLPHFRYLAYKKESLVGHMGVDHRVISVGDSIFKIFGIIDLCVETNYRTQGIATKFLTLLTELAQKKSIDFLFVVAPDHRLYLNNGFKVICNYCFWLRLHEHKNYGVAVEKIENELLVKQIGTKSWSDEPIDLLGYLF